MLCLNTYSRPHQGRNIILNLFQLCLPICCLRSDDEWIALETTTEGTNTHFHSKQYNSHTENVSWTLTCTAFETFWRSGRERRWQLSSARCKTKKHQVYSSRQWATLGISIVMSHRNVPWIVCTVDWTRRQPSSPSEDWGPLWRHVHESANQAGTGRFYSVCLLSNGSDYNDSMQRQRVRSNDRRN